MKYIASLHYIGKEIRALRETGVRGQRTDGRTAGQTIEKHNTSPPIVGGGIKSEACRSVVVLANAEKFRRQLSISREIPMLIELGT